MRTLMFGVLALAGLAGTASADLVSGPVAGNSVQFSAQSPHGFTSAREVTGGTRSYGDTFNIELLAQNTTQAFFITSLSGANTPYNGTATSVGDLVTYNPSAGHPASSIGIEVVGADTLVQVAVFSSSNPQFDVLPAGVNPGGTGGNLTAIRMDMGAGAAGTNKLTPYPLFNIISAQVVLFAGSSAIFSANLTSGNGSFAGQVNQTGLSDISVIGGTAGAGITEMDFIYHIVQVPAPGSLALLGMGGLFAARRRRA
jgi:hypothetical protein